MQRALRRGEHQLDAVELVHFARAGVIVDSDNVCAGIGRAQRLDDALADDMIRQARKGLNAHDVRRAGGDELCHFSCEEPTLTVLIADREEGLGKLGDMTDGHGRSKALAGFERLNGRPAHALKCRNAELGAGRSSPPLSKVGVLEVLLIDRGGKEIEKIGNDRLCALALQKVDDVVVGERHVLD